MNQKAILISSYAALILVGGIIGYVAAGSFISIAVSSVFALLLFACSYFVMNGNQMAYTIATTLIFCLMLFFGYRFFLTYKIAPGGIMAIISAALFAYLTIKKDVFA